MKKGKKISVVLVTVVAVGLILGMFYWVFMRPVFAREDCASLATYGAQQISKSSKISPSVYNDYYTECLQSKGL